MKKDIDKKEFYDSVIESIKSEVRHIIDLHLKCNISKKFIASILGVSQPTITEWYYGKKIPSSKHYCALKYCQLVLFLVFGEEKEDVK